MLSSKLIATAGVTNIVSYLLRDEFTTNRSAGSINSTVAEPGPGMRSVTDTENKLSISGGQLLISNGKTAPSQGDPRIEYDQQARDAGLLYNSQVSTNSNSKDFKVGWKIPVSTNSLYGSLAFTSSGAGLRFDDNGTAGPVIGLTYTANQNYNIAIALRASGAMLFLHGHQYSNYELLCVTDTATNSPLIPCINNYNATITADNQRVPQTLRYLPIPLASDGFASWGTTDGLGHAETIGKGSGGSGKDWTQLFGTFGANAGKAQASALDNTTNNSAAYVNVITPDVLITATLVRTAGEVGLALRIIDTNNFIIVSHDGTNLKMTTVIGGTYSSTTNATAFGAGKIQIWFKGTNLNIVWNNVKIGSTRSIVNYLFDRSTKFGIYTTDLSNTIDNFCIYAIGIMTPKSWTEV